MYQPNLEQDPEKRVEAGLRRTCKLIVPGVLLPGEEAAETQIIIATLNFIKIWPLCCVFAFFLFVSLSIRRFWGKRGKMEAKNGES